MISNKNEQIFTDNLPQDGAGEQQQQHQQTVEEALYILGKNLLGRDVIDKISPVAKKFAAGLGQIGQGVSTLGETLPPLPTVEFDKGKLRLLPNHNYNNNNNLKEAPADNVASGQGQRDERHTGPVNGDKVKTFPHF